MKVLKTLVIILCISIKAFSQSEQDTTKNEQQEEFKVEVVAQYPGGMEKMLAFLKQEFKYPKYARKKGIDGKVFVQFVIDKNGEIDKESIQVIKGLCVPCDDEAIRVVSLFPKWIPATLNGEPVKCRFVLPIVFKR